VLQEFGETIVNRDKLPFATGDPDTDKTLGINKFCFLFNWC